MRPSLILLFVIANLIAGCATSGSNPVVDMPSWMGGLPADAPPRPVPMAPRNALTSFMSAFEPSPATAISSSNSHDLRSDLSPPCEPSNRRRGEGASENGHGCHQFVVMGTNRSLSA
jgi:hypothetical protein